MQVFQRNLTRHKILRFDTPTEFSKNALLDLCENFEAKHPQNGSIKRSLFCEPTLEENFSTTKGWHYRLKILIYIYVPRGREEG